MSGSRLPSERLIAHCVERLLVERLPAAWAARVSMEAKRGDARGDLLFEVTSPSGDCATLAVEVERTVAPREVDRIAERALRTARSCEPDAVPAVASSYLSPRSRELLDELRIGYFDTTGNVRIEMSAPGLFVLTPGADRDPWPRDGRLQSLRGRGAARAVRAIVDGTPPFGVRDLAASTGASAATLSRVLSLLERDRIVVRERRGPVLSVDRPAAIRRWAQDYDQMDSNTATAYLEPRGLRALEKSLAASGLRYAATGAFAAQRFEPIAPAPTAAVYVEDSYEAAIRLGLREADVGANVVLLEPLDPVVFDGAVTRDDLWCVAPSQLAADLLTGPGREPSQGAEFLRRMQGEEHVE